MKLKNVLFTAVLIMAICASCAPAGQTAAEETEVEEETAGSDQKEAYRKSVGALFEEDGLLSGVLPEGTDPDAMIDEAIEQTSQTGRKLNRTFEEILEKARDQTDGLSEEEVRNFAEELLSRAAFPGTDDSEGSGYDAFDEEIKLYGDAVNAQNEYIKEYNAGLMDCAEVQIVSNSNCYQDRFIQEEVKFLNAVIQNNYRMDEDNQLRLVSSSEDFVLFTHKRDEDGNYQIADAVFAEKGDNLVLSLEEMCSQVGMTTDECLESQAENRVSVLYDLKTYMEEHPEVKGIEYDGEIRTAEELDAIWDAKLEELYGDESAD